MFHLNSVESGQDSKGSYLDKELSIFVKMFEFYLVTESL